MLGLQIDEIGAAIESDESDVADEVDADAEVDVASTTRNIPLPELQQIIAAVEASTAMKGRRRRRRRHVVLRFIMKYSDDIEYELD